MIAGYVGQSDKLDRALCRFARAYADQTEADHQALVRAVARGVLPCAPEDPAATRMRNRSNVHVLKPGQRRRH